MDHFNACECCLEIEQPRERGALSESTGAVRGVLEERAFKLSLE